MGLAGQAPFLQARGDDKVEQLLCLVKKSLLY